jgi:hypothetical protein
MMRTRTALGIACAFALTVGCGGNFVPAGDGGPPGSDGGTDAPGKSETGSPDSGSDTGPGGACPSSAPTESAACSPVGLECEYGSNPNPDCNQLWDCTTAGWSNDTAKTGCPPAGDCPPSYAAAMGTGAAVTCALAEEDLTCSYPQGTCICSDGSLPTVGGPDWMCIPATASCPSPRPALGSACSDPGTECDYGACSGGIAIMCKDGVWQQDKMVACPG